MLRFLFQLAANRCKRIIVSVSQQIVLILWTISNEFLKILLKWIICSQSQTKLGQMFWFSSPLSY